MVVPQFSFKLATISVTIVLELFTLPHTTAWAQNISLPSQKVALNWTPPDRGAPRQTEGAASRDEGKCPQDQTKPNPPLMALMPRDSLVLTAAERPTFFVYVPQTSARSAEFVLKDENEEEVYTTTITLSGKTGVIGISLPENAKALENGKTYRWYFDIICSSTARLFVDRMMIQKTQLSADIVSQLDRATARDRVAIYAKNGIWYDTLQTLATLRRSSPNDAALAAEWKQLLESAGLKEVADKPLID